ILKHVLDRDVIDQGSAGKRMVIVDLDSTGANCSHDRRSPVKFDPFPRKWGFLVAKASQRHKLHLRRVSCSIAFLRRQFYRGLLSDITSDQRIFKAFRQPAFDSYDKPGPVR